MIKNKIWIKDAVNNGVFNFYVGQKVILSRRKQNGYPKGIKDGEIYEVKRINNDNLIIREYKDSHPYLKESEYKIHYSYFVPFQTQRDILIEEILNFNPEEIEK